MDIPRPVERPKERGLLQNLWFVTVVGGIVASIIGTLIYASTWASEPDKPWWEEVFETDTPMTWITRPLGTQGLGIEARVRQRGDKAFHRGVSAVPGETLDWLVSVANTGPETQSNVVVSLAPPPHLTAVPKTTKWYTAHARDGLPLEFDRLNTTHGNGGIILGNYAQGGGLLIRFTTRVGGDFPECSSVVRMLFRTKSKTQAEIVDAVDVRITRC